MSDDVDRASEREQEARDDALRAQQRRAALGKADRSARVCHDCREPIPGARRMAMPGCTLCVECQGRKEKGAAA